MKVENPAPFRERGSTDGLRGVGFWPVEGDLQWPLTVVHHDDAWQLLQGHVDRAGAQEVAHAIEQLFPVDLVPDHVLLAVLIKRGEQPGRLVDVQHARSGLREKPSERVGLHVVTLDVVRVLFQTIEQIHRVDRLEPDSDVTRQVGTLCRQAKIVALGESREKTLAIRLDRLQMPLACCGNGWLLSHHFTSISRFARHGYVKTAMLLG